MPNHDVPERDLDFIIGDNAAGRLIGLIQRIERLDEEIGALKEDRKEVLAEAKDEGFDSSTINNVVRLRKADPTKRQKKEALLDLYMGALEKQTGDSTDD